jgi:hypothetical protein
MRIVNPSFGLPEAVASSREPAARVATDWSRDPIAIVSNSKPNARELLEGVRAQMGAYRSTGNIDYLFKDSAAQPAPAELIDQIAQNYKGAILALAD